MNSKFIKQIQKRRTLAIISHPDAGKTTITEKVLLFGQAIQIAGTVKGRGSNQYAKSDWMEIEKQRGISITTSVMQFPYKGCMINLLDTPGHADFSEDTYRTLTAVDCCLMVIDTAKGVEERTRKLMEVTRLRHTPILTFMNKLDRDIRDPIDILDEIEKELKIACSPITWPVGSGRYFKGVYHLYEDKTYLYQTGKGHTIQKIKSIEGLNNPELEVVLGEDVATQLRQELELIKGASHKFDLNAFLSGQLTPVFFGTALGNFGVDHILDALVTWSPSPTEREAEQRKVFAEEEKLTGFIFKIQANMDPKHRDRIAFMRIVSGSYKKGMKLFQVRTQKELMVSDALTFMAGDRTQAEDSFPGDIIGLHNHGTIQIGDTFTQGETLKFTGIPHFAPELFRQIRLSDPLKQKQLLKGLSQLSEEGAVQIFRPLSNNNMILGAVGALQFDVVVSRLKNEYHVSAVYDVVNICTVCWVSCYEKKEWAEFTKKNENNLALDGGNHLSYLAPTLVDLRMVQERHPKIIFRKIREQ